MFVLVAQSSLRRRLSLRRRDRSVGENDVGLVAEGGKRLDQLVVAQLEEGGIDLGPLVLGDLQLTEQGQAEVAGEELADGFVVLVADRSLELLQRQPALLQVPGHE